MSVRARNNIATFLKYVVLIAVGFVMIYPLLWMIGATFKTNNEIFSGIGIFPKNPTIQGYIDALNNYGGDIDIIHSMINTYSYVIPKVIFTVISSLLTAYGFGRFHFKSKNFFFALMLCMLFLPQVVLNVPQYLLFNNFGWVDSQWYAALIIPTLFATESYFIFMLVQFMRNVPREMDEAAQIDGCNSFQTLYKVIAPMLSPALVSVALFQFMWSSNDFMGPLLYVKTPQRYPAALFVKLSMDADSGFAWNRVLAVSVISILPSLIVFFLAQNKFVDGISAGSVKG